MRTRRHRNIWYAKYRDRSYWAQWITYENGVIVNARWINLAVLPMGEK